MNWLHRSISCSFGAPFIDQVQSRSRYIVIPLIVVVGVGFALWHQNTALADTRYFGTFSGQTYRNNFGGSCPMSQSPGDPFTNCYQGTWGDTSLYAGQQVYWVGVAETSTRWQAVYYNQYANYEWVATGHRCNSNPAWPNYCLVQGTYVSTNGIDYDANFAHRAYNEHQDLWTGEVGWTSDGFCGQQNLSPHDCP